jgi:hypothetical protein
MLRAHHPSGSCRVHFFEYCIPRVSAGWAERVRNGLRNSDDKTCMHSGPGACVGAQHRRLLPPSTHTRTHTRTHAHTHTRTHTHTTFLRRARRSCVLCCPIVAVPALAASRSGRFGVAPPWRYPYKRAVTHLGVDENEHAERNVRQPEVARQECRLEQRLPHVDVAALNRGWERGSWECARGVAPRNCTPSTWRPREAWRRGLLQRTRGARLQTWRS